MWLAIAFLAERLPAQASDQPFVANFAGERKIARA
jgi:hypothetical protein